MEVEDVVLFLVVKTVLMLRVVCVYHMVVVYVVLRMDVPRVLRVKRKDV
jgi:hypothetical protein